MRYRGPRLWVMVHLILATATTKVSGKFRFDNTIMSDKKVLDGLLNKTHYDKRIRPPAPRDVIISEGSLQPKDQSSKCANATIVYANVVVLSLFSPDESSLKYEVEFLMHQHWRDSRLSFEDDQLATHYEYLNGIHHQEDIWIPDTYFVKHGDFKQLQLPSNIALRILRDGSVTYTIRRLLSLACEGDLNIFPFDFPKCSFAMESVSYERHEMVYRWKDTDQLPLYFLPEMHVLNAYIIGNETKDRCDDRLAWRGNYSCLRVHMVFTRDRSFYFSTVFIPGMLLVTSSFITFWLEWNAVPGRVMLGVTTMLNFFTTSNNFRSNLPVVSNLTAMNVWDGVCMCFIYASLLEFVTVNYLGRKKPRPIRCYRPVNAGTGPLKTTNDNGSYDKVSRGHESNDGCTSCLTNKCTCNGCKSAVEKRPARQSSPSAASQPTSGSGPQPLVGITKDNVEPPQKPRPTYLDLAHPLRVAKTIDVVSRVVFPVAYGVFLIFFFARYSGFS